MPIGETIITVVGNLTADPELSATQGGVPRVAFTVASNSRNWDRDRAEWGEGRTLFLRCTAFRWLAENTAQSLHKGDRVIVTGALRQWEYTSADHVQRTGYGIDVEDIAVSLRYATATVKRTNRSSADAPPTDDPWAASAPPKGRRSKASQPVDDPWASTGAGFSDEPPF
ncbi:single-stranded DNA-binding protein [Streptacidiphilus monticola]|uniref:Single-stranded DNA-binding protein n=1 Tax=Streptacidiphilus monticola TaxID=2161674 RepID=A0ABW1G6D9_9ACTN